MTILLSFIALVIFIIWMVSQVNSGNRFRDASRAIQIGMHKLDVINIMGLPSYTKNNMDGSYEYVYEKSEWKGLFRGGTQTRRMEVTFDNKDFVISVGKNDNCDRSGW